MLFRRRFKDKYAGSSRERICCPNSVRLVFLVEDKRSSRITDFLCCLIWTIWFNGKWTKMSFSTFLTNDFCTTTLSKKYISNRMSFLFKCWLKIVETTPSACRDFARRNQSFARARDLATIGFMPRIREREKGWRECGRNRGEGGTDEKDGW